MSQNMLDSDYLDHAEAKGIHFLVCHDIVAPHGGALEPAALHH